MPSIRGSCLCQAVQFELDADFGGLFLCHCSRCRKTSGTAHASNLFAKGRLIWLSGERDVRNYELTGTRFVRAFCGTCSSLLPFPKSDGTILVPVGSLDSPLGMEARAHIMMGSRADWDPFQKEIPCFEGLPSV